MNWRYERKPVVPGFNIFNANGDFIGEFLNESDAKLAAKSPELYEALKEIVYATKHKSRNAYKKGFELIERLEAS